MHWKGGIATLLKLLLVAHGHSRLALAGDTSTSVTNVLNRKMSPELQMLDWQDKADRLRMKQIKAWAAPDGHIMWTLANYSWLDFVLNWIASVDLAGVDYYFVACLDDRLLIELKKRAVPCVNLNSSLGSQDLDWGSDAFKARGMEKIKLIQQMLLADLHPLFSDLDVVWLRNPLPYVRHLLDANVLASTDSCQPVNGVLLDDCPSLLPSSRDVVGTTYVGFMNVGIHLLRPSALPFVQAWYIEMIKSGQMEQLCWNNVFARTMVDNQSSIADPYCRAMKNVIRAGLFPAALFQNGHTFFVERTAQTLGHKPYAVHASYVPGKVVKTHHFREALLWHVDPMERFGSKQRLLSLDLDIPAELLQNAGPPENSTHELNRTEVVGHLKLVQYQAAQVKAAAWLAKALNRTLVLPQLWCGLENLWFPHQGRIWPSFEYPLPAPCVMSQIFHPDSWREKAEPDGPLPPFLESSYFQNKRVRLKRGDVVQVKPCEETVRGSGGNVTRYCCSTPNDGCLPAQDSLRLDTRLGQDAHVQFLQGWKHTRVLKLSHANRLWRANPGDAPSKFDIAFSEVLKHWCCLEGNLEVNINVPLQTGETVTQTQ